MTALALEQREKVRILTALAANLLLLGAGENAILLSLASVDRLAIKGVETTTWKLYTSGRRDKVVPAGLAAIWVLVGVAVVGGAGELGVTRLETAVQTLQIVLRRNLDTLLLNAGLVAVAAAEHVIQIEESVLNLNVLLNTPACLAVDLLVNIVDILAAEVRVLIHPPSVLLLIATVAIVDITGVVVKSSKHRGDSVLYV